MQPLSRALRHSASSRLSVASALPQLLGSRAPARAMGGGGGHDHTLEPPLQRLPLPNRPLPEEDELIWNDRVAPETALDLDAPHVSPLEGLLMWLGGFAFFFGVYQYAVSTSHPANKPTVSGGVCAQGWRAQQGLGAAPLCCCWLLAGCWLAAGCWLRALTCTHSAVLLLPTHTHTRLSTSSQNKRELPEEDIARALGGYAKGGYAHQ